MNVGELIEALEKMPKNAQVIYRYCSEYDVLECPRLCRAEEKKIILRNGRYMAASETWYEPGKDNEWVTVVTLH